jgi:colanic acid/amylovoran biosynthesis glycosyltransferase
MATENTICVLHSVPRWLPRTATWLHNQLRYLPESVSNHIACESTENLTEFSVKNLHCMENRTKPSLWESRLYRKLRLGLLLERPYVKHLVDVANRYGVQVLHSHWGDWACRVAPAAQQLRIPHAVTFYGKDVNFFPQQNYWRRRYRALFKSVDLVLCEGPHMAGRVVALGCPSDKVQVHHLGVETGRIRFQPRIWVDGPLRVLLAGSFREKKGLPDALEALGQLHRELPDLEITIIGDADADPRSHPEKARILGKLEQHQLLPKTRLLGYQPHRVLFEESYKHHVFMSPSLTAKDGDTEGGAPVTLIEMAATGMPVVSTTHCDIPSVVIDGKTGLLAKERDPEGLLRHLRWLVSHQYQWEQIARAGRSHIELEFDVVKQASRLQDLYFRLKSVGRRS